MGSYLLRLVEKARAQGRVAGTVEVLDTGEVVPLRSADDLIVLLLAQKPDDNPVDGGDRS